MAKMGYPEEIAQHRCVEADDRELVPGQSRLWMVYMRPRWTQPGHLEACCTHDCCTLIHVWMIVPGRHHELRVDADVREFIYALHMCIVP